MADLDSGGLPRIVSVLLKGSTENAYLFVFDVEVQGFKDPLEEFLLSVLVHINDCLPVVGDFIQTLHLGKVSKRQDSFLEATASKPHATVQKLIANPAIARDASLDFLNISFVLLAEYRDAVDGAYPLG